MKTLICTARNHRVFVKDNGELNPEIEAVLTLSEKQIEYIGTGLVNVEKTETVRFAMSPESARKVAENLNTWADEADELEERLEVKPVEPVSNPYASGE